MTRLFMRVSDGFHRPARSRPRLIPGLTIIESAYPKGDQLKCVVREVPDQILNGIGMHWLRTPSSLASASESGVERPHHWAVLRALRKGMKLTDVMAFIECCGCKLRLASVMDLGVFGTAYCGINIGKCYAVGTCASGESVPSLAFWLDDTKRTGARPGLPLEYGSFPEDITPDMYILACAPSAEKL